MYNEQLYKFEGLLPMTRKQIIAYMKDGNHLTKKNGKYFLTGGIPFYITKKGIQKVIKLTQECYSGYEEYFDVLLKNGTIEKAFG